MMASTDECFLLYNLYRLIGCGETLIDLLILLYLWKIFLYVSSRRGAGRLADHESYLVNISVVSCPQRLVPSFWRSLVERCVPILVAP